MSMTGILLFAAAYILFLLAVFAAVVYLFILIVKALKKYIASKEVREEKKAVAKSLGEALKENRVRCQMTQEFVAWASAASPFPSGKTVPATRTPPT